MTTLSRPGVTVRLDTEAHERLRRIAAAEHRSVATYLELLVARDLAAREDAERVVRVHVAAGLPAVSPGPLRREPNESETRHARRGATVDALFGTR